VSRTTTRRLSLAGAAVSLTLALAACGGSGHDGTAAVASGAATDPGPAVVPSPGPESVAAPPTAAEAAPATTAPAAPRSATPTTVHRATTPSSTPTAAPAAPPTTAAPVTPKFAPGQRINPTSAQVQAAIGSLTQRIPLFKPTEPQMRTFADAACSSFDQGQTLAQVQSTIRRAVTYVQGASLSAADAEFAVRVVVQLRCPGYLQ
jgi:hypothetical protein